MEELSEIEIPESYDPVVEEAFVPAPVDLQLLLQDLPALMEAMVFASPEPLTRSKVQEVFERKGLSLTTLIIEEALAQMVARWSESNRVAGAGLQLTQVAGGWVFRTKSEYGPILRGLMEEKPARLSQAQLEALAIIAYRQPVTRMEVEEIRGVDSSASMRRLLNLKVIKILGKSEGLGRPLLYGTTKYFLEFFGLNSLHDLPTLKEYQDLDKDGEKGQDTSNEGPVTVKDLFAQSAQSMFSETTEKMSVEALKNLDAALGVIDQTTKEVDVDAILGKKDFE